jgi:Histidine kinase
MSEGERASCHIVPNFSHINMPLGVHQKNKKGYWLKIFAFYALTEAAIQIIYFFLLNYFGTVRISIIEYHFVMWGFQCLLIWPIWWVAKLVHKQAVIVQVLVNAAFYMVYSAAWFGPVQEAIMVVYNHLQEITRAVADRQEAVLDRGDEYSYRSYQLLKHSFRLSWFYVAAFFYHYRSEEMQRTELAIANKELQLKTLKWHLNSSFYFKTIHYLQQVAGQQPIDAVKPILQLSKIMEYVIYEAKEKLISVKRELLFLENYIQLLNKQHEDNCRFTLTVQGEYSHLTIAPLLLNGMLDALMDVENEKELAQYDITLTFAANKMLIRIGKPSNTAILLSPNLVVPKQFRELYNGRFVCHPDAGANMPQFIIMLDEG